MFKIHKSEPMYTYIISLKYKIVKTGVPLIPNVAQENFSLCWNILKNNFFIT